MGRNNNSSSNNGSPGLNRSSQPKVPQASGSNNTLQSHLNTGSIDQSPKSRQQINPDDLSLRPVNIESVNDLNERVELEIKENKTPDYVQEQPEFRVDHSETPKEGDIKPINETQEEEKEDSENELSSQKRNEVMGSQPTLNTSQQDKSGNITHDQTPLAIRSGMSSRVELNPSNMTYNSDKRITKQSQFKGTQKSCSEDDEESFLEQQRTDQPKSQQQNQLQNDIYNKTETPNPPSQSASQLLNGRDSQASASFGGGEKQFNPSHMSRPKSDQTNGDLNEILGEELTPGMRSNELGQGENATDNTNRLSEAAVQKPLSSNSNGYGLSDEFEVREPASGEESSELIQQHRGGTQNPIMVQNESAEGLNQAPDISVSDANIQPGQSHQGSLQHRVSGLSPGGESLYSSIQRSDEDQDQ